MTADNRKRDLTMWRAGALLAQKRALEQAYANKDAALSAQLPQIKRQYDAQRSQDYQATQFAQQAGAETLAARGLLQGGAPSSGYAQVQNARRSAALQGALLQSMLRQQGEVEAVQQQRQEALHERDTAMQQGNASIQKQYLDALAQLSQMEEQRQWNAQQLSLSQQQFAQQMAQQLSQQALSQQAQRVENAWRTAQALGYVPNETIAQLIGVPVGAKLFTP